MGVGAGLYMYDVVVKKFTFAQGVIKPLFCVLEDELLSASDELLRERGQPHHVVRSHNELNVAKVASCVGPKQVFSTFFKFFQN